MNWYRTAVLILVVVLLLWLATSYENYTNDHLWSRLVGRTGGTVNVVLYGTTWCPICQNLRENVWPKLQKDLPALVFDTVDCDANKDLCMRAGIGSYPTILIEKDRVVRPYRGSWRYEDLLVELRNY